MANQFTASQPDQEAEQMLGSDTNMSAQQLAHASAHALRALGVRPMDMVKSWGQVAKLHTSKEARREALGQPRLREAGSQEENWLFQAQAASAARNILALVRDGGLEAKGEALGAFRVFYSSLDEPAKRMVLSDAADMGPNPQWQAYLASLAGAEPSANAGEMMKAAAAPSLVEGGLGSMFADLQSSVAESTLVAAAWKNLSGDAGGKGAQRAAMFAKGGIEDMVDSIAQLKEATAQQEVETGLSWREQGFSARFVKSVDIQLSSMAVSMVALTAQASVDPGKSPQIKAAMRALCSLMSQSEASRMLDWVGGSPDGQSLPMGKGWDGLASEMRRSVLWSVGAAIPAAAAASRPAPESLVPVPTIALQSSVTIIDLINGGVVPSPGAIVDGRRPQAASAAPKPELALAAVPSPQYDAGKVLDAQLDGAGVPAWQRPAPSRAAQRQAPILTERASPPVDIELPINLEAVPAHVSAMRQAGYKDGHSLGAQVGRVMRGFVASFSPAAMGAKADQGFAKIDAGLAKLDQRFASAAQGGKAKIKQALAKGLSGFESGVLAANAWTDQMEATMKAKGVDAVHAMAGALDGALEGVQQSAKAARHAFVGRVGELRDASYQVAGGVALKAADALPQSVKDGTANGSGHKSVAFTQLAMMAGALFVGATMAPVAGLLGATVGAVLAGAGAATALSKAAKFLASKAVQAPAALEAIGAKLGAKRTAAAEAESPRVDPAFGSPAA